MTKDEYKNLLLLIKSFYPNWTLNIKSREVVESWYNLLQDMKYVNAKENLMEFVKESKFPPTISDLRKEKPSPVKHNFKQKHLSNEELEAIVRRKSKGRKIKEGDI